MNIHRTEHHQTYITNLNNALGNATLESMAVDELCRNLDKVSEDKRPVVRNNGGGHYNHSLFWTLMGPNKGGAPAGALAKAIDDSFGIVDQFKEAFTKAAVGDRQVDGRGTSRRAAASPSRPRRTRTIH